MTVSVYNIHDWTIKIITYTIKCKYKFKEVISHILHGLWISTWFCCHINHNINI
jgi:hypothetical protein